MNSRASCPSWPRNKTQPNNLMGVRLTSGPQVFGPGQLPPPPKGLAALWQKYRLSLKRRRLIGRAIRKRRDLSCRINRMKDLPKEAILCFVVLRNESLRLPYFLDYHRALGVSHFVIVDNDSTDGSADYLAAQKDVSLWQTSHSYRSARFGLDWTNWLMLRYGHGRWCLVLDADELLVYPYHETRPLPALTEWMEGRGLDMLGSFMLELYPQGPLSQSSYQPGADPVETIPYFDAGNYSLKVQSRMRNLWIQGGPRMRHFFADNPHQAPTLNKIPLIKWHWRYAWLNSTHSLLPAKMNAVFDEKGGERISGVLLHTKFLPQIAEKSREDLQRRQHFTDPSRFGHYYEGLLEDPTLFCAQSKRYEGWRQLEGLGLISRGGWL